LSTLIVTKWGARLNNWHVPCAIGRGGIGTKRGEGDGISPVGEFTLTQWLYRPDRLCLSSATPIRPHETWSDDPNDPAYNTKTRWGSTGGYSHERLFRADPLYDLVGVLNYNRAPVIPGKGSAIFLHIWRKPRHPTEGCIAFARPDFLKLQTALPAGSAVLISA